MRSLSQKGLPRNAPGSYPCLYHSGISCISQSPLPWYDARLRQCLFEIVLACFILLAFFYYSCQVYKFTASPFIHGLVTSLCWLVAHPELSKATRNISIMVLIKVVFMVISSYSFVDNNKESGRLGALPPHSPLRIVRDSFPSYGSSISKGSPCGAARLYYLAKRSLTPDTPGLT